MIRQPWHPPYYRELCERAGLDKAMDLLMWKLDISDRAKILPVIFELAEQVRARARDPPAAHDAGARLRKDMDRLRRDLQRGLGAELGLRARTTRPTSTPTRRSCSSSSTRTGSWSPSGSTTARRSALAITVPGHQPGAREDERAACCRSAGGTSCAGGKIIDRCRVGFLGVKPEYQHTGVAAQLYVEHFDMAEIGAGQVAARWAGSSRPTSPMNRGMEAMGGQVVKRYRMYERLLEPGAEPAYPADAKVWTPTRERDRRRVLIARVAFPDGAVRAARIAAHRGRGGRRRPRDRRAPAAGAALGRRRSCARRRSSSPARSPSGAATAVVVAHRRARRARRRRPARRRRARGRSTSPRAARSWSTCTCSNRKP